MAKTSRVERNAWYKKEFNNISNLLQKEESLSLHNFLLIRNYKLQNLSVTGEEKVREITKEAFNLVKDTDNEQAIKKALCLLQEGLHGARIPIASAILAMKFPTRFAIIDKRVIKKLDKEEWLSNYETNPETYIKYLSYLKETKPSSMTLRDYEFKLYSETKTEFMDISSTPATLLH